MTCQALVELVTDYLEGTMPEPDRTRFEAHLEICPGCVYYVDQIGETIRLAGRIELERLPGIDVLIDAFRDWKRGGLPENV
jgi:predicted anti-sigma-YlaC factor YlaD